MLPKPTDVEYIPKPVFKIVTFDKVRYHNITAAVILSKGKFGPKRGIFMAPAEVYKSKCWMDGWYVHSMAFSLLQLLLLICLVKVL